MTIQRGPLTFTLLAVLLLSALAEAHPVTNAELGFSFDLPEDATEERSGDPDTLYAYSVPRGEYTIRVTINRRHKLLSPYEPSLRDAPELQTRVPGSTVEERTWSSFTAEGFRVPKTTTSGQHVVAHLGYVPLSPESLLVTVWGRAEDEAETRAVMRQTLSSIHGKTNWKTPEEKNAEQKAVRTKTALVLGGWASAGAILGLGLFVYRRIRRSGANRT